MQVDACALASESMVYARICVDNKLVIYKRGWLVIERVKAKLAVHRVATRNSSYEAEQEIRWYAFLHMRIGIRRFLYP
jgi:hypothetical protein